MRFLSCFIILSGCIFDSLRIRIKGRRHWKQGFVFIRFWGTGSMNLGLYGWRVTVVPFAALVRECKVHKMFSSTRRHCCCTCAFVFQTFGSKCAFEPTSNIMLFDPRTKYRDFVFKPRIGNSGRTHVLVGAMFKPSAQNLKWSHATASGNNIRQQLVASVFDAGA